MSAVIDTPKTKAKTAAKVANKLSPPPIGESIDSLYDLREEKRKLEEQVKTVEGRIEAAQEELLERLKTEKTDAMRGSKATVSITRTTVANVLDWDEVCKYVKKTGSFQLFQRRISDAAYRELMEKGKKIPGLQAFTRERLNLRALDKA